jgi:hypothetical protein
MEGVKCQTPAVCFSIPFHSFLTGMLILFVGIYVPLPNHHPQRKGHSRRKGSRSIRR